MRYIFFLSTLFLAINFSTLYASAEEAPLPVLVSIAPQQWIVEQIAGEKNVDITVLVRPGTDAHSYEPTPSQMKSAQKAKVYFTIGMPFESIWIPKISDSTKNMSLCSMTQGLTRIEEHMHSSESASKHGENLTQGDFHSESEHHHHDEVDPHTWLSPTYVLKMIPIVTKELSRHIPSKSELFEKNAYSLAQKINDVHTAMVLKFAAIEDKTRVFLTFHPAWQYFAHDYSLRELTIEVEGKEPGPKTMKQIIDIARLHKITTVFSEPQFSKAAVTAIAQNIKAKVVTIDPLGKNILETWEKMTTLLLQSWDK